MKISELKKLEDKEFIKAISEITRNKSQFCLKCGKVITINDRRTISVSKDNIKVRKLCTLCEECYTDMLDNLGIADVDL